MSRKMNFELSGVSIHIIGEKLNEYLKTSKGKMVQEMNDQVTHNANKNNGQWQPKVKQVAPPSFYEKSTKSDFGTVLLHLVVVITCTISLLTGLRLAADEETAKFAAWLSPILPQGEIWSWHIISGLGIFFAASAYVVYLNRSGLMRRTGLSRVRAIAMEGVALKMKYAGVNVALHWLLYAMIAILTCTGILLYQGFAGVVLTLHLIAAYVVLSYFFAHIITHFLYGGWWQLLRVINPAPLQKTALTKTKPIALALLIGATSAFLLYGMEWITRDSLTVKAVATPPVLDGIGNDDAWGLSQSVMIRTMQGSNLGAEGSRGTSKVWIKAVKHSDMVYFQFKWEDPTRSVIRLPLIKMEDGWHILGNHPDNADETHFYEDKFAALFSKSDRFGNGGTTHMGPRPLAGAPPALNDRGLHYTKEGDLADVWQWKASRGGLLGKIDDMYFGPPKPFTQGMVEGKARYSAGYDNDPGRAFYLYNFLPEPKGGFKGAVKLRRLPKDYRQTVPKLGVYNKTPGKNHIEEGAQWWLTDEDTVEYSKAHDDTIPVGTIIPSTLISGKYEGDRNDVNGAAKWKDGYWTLEVARKAETGSIYDVALKGDLFLYVSVFDNAQTRHTRHMRAVKLKFD